MKKGSTKPHKNNPNPNPNTLWSLVKHINWLLSPLNLPTDLNTQLYMGLDFWLDATLLLHRNNLYPTPDQTRQLLSLLSSHSIIVQVDTANQRVRPAWVLRSILVLENVPAQADVNEIKFLLGRRVPGAPLYSPDGRRSMPDFPLPKGLVGIEQICGGVWIGVFDSVDGAHMNLQNTVEKSCFGQHVYSYVYEEVAWDTCCTGDGKVHGRNVVPQWEVFKKYFPGVVGLDFCCANGHMMQQQQLQCGVGEMRWPKKVAAMLMPYPYE